jgi:hypothetical protein
LREHRAAAGVEQRVILQRADGSGDRVQCRAAGLQDLPTRREGGAQAGVMRVRAGLVQAGGGNGAGAAMNGEGRFSAGLNRRSRPFW